MLSYKLPQFCSVPRIVPLVGAAIVLPQQCLKNPIAQQLSTVEVTVTASDVPDVCCPVLLASGCPVCLAPVYEAEHPIIDRIVASPEITTLFAPESGFAKP